MKSNNENQLIQYLDKNYIIKNDYFFSRHIQQQEWGFDICEALSKIFDLPSVLTCEIFGKWAINQGLSENNFHLALNPRFLNFSWNPELAQDMSFYRPSNAEAELMVIMLDELEKEIDISFVRWIKPKTGEELLSLMRCLGYKPGLLVFNPDTLAPKRKFMSMTYNEIHNERQNNPHWQDWIKNTTS